jgi:hypothetical protein
MLEYSHVGSEKSHSGYSAEIFAIISERGPIGDGLKSRGMSLLDLISGGRFITNRSQLMNAPGYLPSETPIFQLWQ